jgi:transcriptional regulator with XRE-family HTH domain
MTAWNRAVHGRVATAIGDARHGRMTANQLAEETGRLGYPISRAQINNYECERRQSLDILELLVIAQALNVPALTLLFPGQPNSSVDILPGRTVPTVAAKQQFVGNNGLLWPGNIVADLMTQLNALRAAMGGGTGGAGALTAVTTGEAFSAAVTTNVPPGPPATKLPEAQKPRLVDMQMTVAEVKRLEAELNAPLARTSATSPPRS